MRVSDAADSSTPVPAGEAPGSAASARRGGTRALWLVVVGLLLGAGALWGASGLVWVDVPRGLTVGGRMVENLKGSDLVQWPVPIALFALAAVAATLAAPGLLRRILGVLLAVAGAWTVYLALGGDVGEVAWTGWAPGYDAGSGAPHRTFWGPAAAVAGGALIACAGAILVARGHRMVRMGAKYTAPGTRRVIRDPDTELWDALSEGSDPTDPTDTTDTTGATDTTDTADPAHTADSAPDAPERTEPTGEIGEQDRGEQNTGEQNTGEQNTGEQNTGEQDR